MELTGEELLRCFKQSASPFTSASEMIHHTNLMGIPVSIEFVDAYVDFEGP